MHRLAAPPSVSVLSCGLAVALCVSPASGATYSWDFLNCPTGGSWFDVACWAGSSAPGGPEDAAFLELDAPGTISLPPSTFELTMNTIVSTENVSLTVADNTVLQFARSPSGIDPALSISGVMTIDSPEIGGSSLRVASPADPEGTTRLVTFGPGEIRLGTNASIETAPRAKMEIQGGIEIVSLAPVEAPAAINGVLRNNGGEVRVLGGPLVVSGDLENVNGGFVEVFDQFSAGTSSLLLQGTMRGGTLYPGLGIVRVNGGTLADITVEAGPITVEGTLAFLSGSVELSSGSEFTVGPARTLEIGSTLVAGAPVLINDGTIRIGSADGAATFRNDGSIVELLGTGRLVLGHFASSLATTASGIFRNGPGHTIEGKGYVQCGLQNAGLLVVDEGTMTLFSGVTGLGGDTVIQGTPTDPGRLDVRAPFSTRHLRIAPDGRMTVGGGRSIVVQGDYVVESVDESAIAWGFSSGLVFSGPGDGSWQAFETTSEDFGAVAGGFSGNFTIARVAIGGTGSKVFLRDLRDNGNRTTADEAVYANELEVSAGSTLNLNGYCFYTKLNGQPHRVQAGDGALFGGGTIVDDPSTVTAVGDVPSAPADEALRIVPNPFNPRTTIHFRLEEPGRGLVTVHDLRGRRVRTLDRTAWPAGEQAVTWDGRDDDGRTLASGVYVVRVSVGDVDRVRRVTLLK